EGQIALPKDKVQANWLDAKTIAQPFVNCQSLQLMVLNASEGAFGNDSNERDIFCSSANTLVNNGIPSVLSLQYKITDQAKRIFFYTLYKDLANGTSIDAAVSEARKTINAGTSNVLEFGTSFLYTCSPDSSVFDSPQKQQRLSFLQLHWRRLLKTVAVLVLIGTIILFLLSILLNWDLIAKFLTILIAILSLFGIGKTIPQVFQIALNFFRQVPNHLKRLFWPAPHYSRRWFLKGLIYGSASGIILGGLATLTLLSRYSRERSFSSLQATSTADTYLYVNTYSGHAGVVNSVAWSPDGQRIASASDDRTVQIWEWNTNSVDNNPYTGHAGAVNAVAWSPDGQRIASASDDRTVQIWEANNKNIDFKYKEHTQKVTSVAWAPNGNYIASASADGTVQVFNSTTGEKIYVYPGHHGTVNAVAWSPDSKYIVSGGVDGTAQVWEATTGKSIAPANEHGSPVNAVAWSPKETLIVSASSGVRPVDIWNPITRINYKLTLVNDSVVAITWSPTGKWIALTDGYENVQVWDPIKNIFLNYFSGGSTINPLAWAPKGKHIAAGDNYNTVYIWIANE
ncbi:MAG TPA: CHAT domain-containing protein, partial [Methylomirabilota bacterium]|nr:CHAT domain-containing protein [Methylomirabilota bacterium]